MINFIGIVNTHMSKITLPLIVAFLLLLLPAKAQKKYDKLLYKADVKYEYGDYKKAIKGLRKFKSKIDGLGKENNYTPTYFLREARYYWAYGIVVGFENSLNNAIESSRRINNETSKEFVDVKLEVAEIYMLYGNFSTAKSHIEDAIQILAEYHPEQVSLISRSELYLAMALSNQGYYQQALKYINDREEYFKKRLASKEEVADKNGKIKIIKLSEQEQQKRYSDYARLLTYKAKTYGNMGDLENAYNEYEKTRDWIIKEKKWLGSDSYEFIEHQFAFANFKVSNGLNPENLGKGDHKLEGYEHLLNRLGKSHNEAHYLSFDIYEAVLKQYLMNRKSSKYRNMRIKYERAIEKNFQKNSLHQINLDKLEFNSKLDRAKTKNLEDKANSILANIQTLPRDHKTTIDVLDFLYRVAIKERHFNKAEQYLKTAIEIKQTLYGQESPQSHLGKVKLANFYVDYTNKIQEANEIYEKSFYDILQKEITPFHPEYLTILTHIASLREYQDNYSEVKKTLDEATRIALEKYRDNKDIEYAKILERVARLQINMGEYQEGKRNIEYVLDVYDELKIKNDEYQVVYLVQAEQTKAYLMGIFGLFDEAEDLINESQDRLDDARTLEGYNNFEAIDILSGLYVYLGRYTDAEEQISSLVKEYEKIYGKESGKIVPALINRGRLEYLQGKYAEAEKTAETVKRISDTVFGETSVKTASALLLLGEIQINIGDYNQAINFIQDAIRILEARVGTDHINVALAQSLLGVARFYNDEDPKNIESIMLSSQKSISDNLGIDNPRYAEVSINLARIYIKTGQFNEAIQALETSEQIWVNITGKRGSRRNVNVGKVNVLMGDLYYFRKNYDQAENYYTRARDNFKISLNDQHPEFIKVLSRLGRVYYMKGNPDRAKQTMEIAIQNYEQFIKMYFGSLSEREKAKFWNTIKPDFEFYNTIAIQYMSKDDSSIGTMYNNALLTKALLLNSSIKIRERILNSNNEELISEFKDWLAKKEIMTKVLSMSEEDQANANINPAKLSDEIEALEISLSEKSEDFSNEIEENQVSWQEVRNSLDKNEVAMEMVRFRHFNHEFTDSVVYAVLYVSNDRLVRKPQVILLNNGEDLEGKFFRGYKNFITRKFEDPYSYGVYWEPIAKVVGTLSTVYLSPDGVYNKINLEALATGDGKFVIDNSNIVLVSNTKELFLKKNREKNTRNSDSEALMFGDPKFYMTSTADPTVTDLPGTEKEVMELRRLLAQNGFKSDYFIKDEATEEQVKILNNPSVLHIATHGFFNNAVESNSSQMNISEAEAANNPLLQTGLIMSGGGDILKQSKYNYNIDNGILTAYEAMNLNLDKTDLVVLSACETAGGQIEAGEGVFGLQRAFLVAGARTLIMSLFKVDDTATQELMILFYKKWLESGDKRKAFIEAKKELRNKYPEPYYWGSFIMVGLE